MNNRTTRLELASQKIETAIELIKEAVSDCGIAKSQAEGYTIPWLNAWIGDKNQCGNIQSLTEQIEEKVDSGSVPDLDEPLDVEDWEEG